MDNPTRYGNPHPSHGLACIFDSIIHPPIILLGIHLEMNLPNDSGHSKRKVVFSEVLLLTNPRLTDWWNSYDWLRFPPSHSDTGAEVSVYTAHAFAWLLHNDLPSAFHSRIMWITISLVPISVLHMSIAWVEFKSNLANTSWIDRTTALSIPGRSEPPSPLLQHLG